MEALCSWEGISEATGQLSPPLQGSPAASSTTGASWAPPLDVAGTGTGSSRVCLETCSPSKVSGTATFSGLRRGRHPGPVLPPVQTARQVLLLQIRSWVLLSTVLYLGKSRQPPAGMACSSAQTRTQKKYHHAAFQSSTQGGKGVKGVAWATPRTKRKRRGQREARTLDVSTLAAKQFIFLTSIPQFLCLTPLPFLTPVPRVHRPLDKMLPGMWPLGVSGSCGTH